VVLAAAGAAVIAIVVVDVSNEVMDVTSQVPMGTFSQYPYPQVQVQVHVGIGTGRPKFTHGLVMNPTCCR